MLFDERFQFADRSRLALPTEFEGIDVVPANHHLARHNKPEPETGGDLQYVIRELLEELPAYDVVLIDCPPNLYTCSWTAMVASDRVLIPVPPEDFGTQGIRAVHQAVANARTLNPSLRRLGHLLTRVDSRLLIHRSYEKELRAAYGELVLDVTVPEASAFKVALARRRPVEFHEPNSKAAESTRELMREIDARLASKQPRRAAGGA